MHVSNRHLELASVVGRHRAGERRWSTRVNDGGDVDADDESTTFSATVAAVARSEEDFGALAKSEYWPLHEPDPEQWVWTDDYSNIVGALCCATLSEASGGQLPDHAECSLDDTVADASAAPPPRRRPR